MARTSTSIGFPYFPVICISCYFIFLFYHGYDNHIKNLIKCQTNGRNRVFTNNTNIIKRVTAVRQLWSDVYVRRAKGEKTVRAGRAYSGRESKWNVVRRAVKVLTIIITIIMMIITVCSRARMKRLLAG